jgi:type I restriction enzyme R subunit
MNEAETRAEYIDPALKASGWGVVEGSRIRREYPITPGRIEGQGRRGKALTADYVLEYRNHKLAVLEAKAWDEELTEGVGQAKNYADKLAIRFTYSSNGRGIYGIDMLEGKEGHVPSFPSPEELWNRTFAEANEWRDRFASIPFPDKTGSWQIRYYQEVAVERALERITEGGERILLTLATGTGKTSIAFQIAWKLFEARWNLSREPSRRPRILFLADRNTLANQAFNDFNSFAAFEDNALVRVDPDEIRKKGRVPKNASVFFTIFQTFMTGRDAEGSPAPYFGEYPPDFFDFIVIDECHRGGANDESTWREILTYFKPAVQLGLTATPKRKSNVDTYKYFGEPVYRYSLKDGINDGFLTPFKVKQIATTLDDYTYTPDDAIIEGEVVPGKRYVENEFNRVIIIPEREKNRVKIFMDSIGQNEKTLVFCATQKHALMVRDFINQMKKSKDSHYCERVTADDGALGDQHLRDFQDNDKTIPTILTTSQKLSTGVDARNVRNIVLMRPINSIIEFKQIIGRGTRLFDGKDYFTIYDFVKAYQHFNDPEWDGEPLEPEPSASRAARETGPTTPWPEGPDGEPPERPQKLQIKLADGKERTIQHMMATTFWGPDGKPMSAAQFVERLFGELPALFKDEDQLRSLWSEPETRRKLLDALSDKGFGEAELSAIKRMIDAEKSDLYDVLAYIAFALAPITREERVNARKMRIHSAYDDEKLRTFLDFVLGEYVKEGVAELDQAKLTPLLELKYRAVADAARELGGIPKIRNAFIGFQKYLYARAE